LPFHDSGYAGDIPDIAHMNSGTASTIANGGVPRKQQADELWNGVDEGVVRT
jgi:hypothetical protein